MKKNIKLHYKGSIFWLIFWLIVLFPVGLVLLFTSSSFQVGKNLYVFHYSGSKFWICFWTIVFFPIAIILLLVNGFSAEQKKVKSLVKKKLQEAPKVTI